MTLSLCALSSVDPLSGREVSQIPETLVRVPQGSRINRGCVCVCAAESIGCVCVCVCVCVYREQFTI